MKECWCCFKNWLEQWFELFKLKIESLIDSLECFFGKITCGLDSLLCVAKSSDETNYLIYAATASVNPIVVAGNYPANVDGDTVLQYSTTEFALMDLLNPYVVLLLKGKPWVQMPNLPVKFVDTTGYPHNVTVGDVSTPLLSHLVVSNFPYSALYVGNNIIIAPTPATLADFAAGLLN